MKKCPEKRQAAQPLQIRLSGTVWGLCHAPSERLRRLKREHSEIFTEPIRPGRVFGFETNEIEGDIDLGVEKS